MKPSQTSKKSVATEQQAPPTAMLTGHQVPSGEARRSTPSVPVRTAAPAAPAGEGEQPERFPPEDGVYAARHLIHRVPQGESDKMLDLLVSSGRGNTRGGPSSDVRPAGPADPPGAGESTASHRSPEDPVTWWDFPPAHWRKSWSPEGDLVRRTAGTAEPGDQTENRPFARLFGLSCAGARGR